MPDMFHHKSTRLPFHLRTNAILGVGAYQVGTTQRYLYIDARDVAAAVLAVGEPSFSPANAVLQMEA